MDEKKLSQEKDELLKNDDSSIERKVLNENLDLSELEEVAGGIQDNDDQEESQGNGCKVCLGMCGGN